MKATINDRGPFRFFLDTGAGVTVLNKDLAEELDLAGLGEMRVGDPSNPEALRTTKVRLDSVKLGTAEFVTVGAVAMDRSGLYQGDDRPRGVLGFPMLEHCLLTLDYAAGQVRIEFGELPEPDGKSILDYTIDEGGIARFDILVAGETLPCYLDSGAMGGVAIPPEWESKFRFRSPAVVIGQGRTVNSEFEVRAATLDGNVEVGDHIWKSPELRFHPALKSANLGTEALRGFRITLDQKNRRIRFVRGGD